MDVQFEFCGLAFRWDEEKARRNIRKHDGISFERSAEAFFDPFFRIVDASPGGEARDAVIGRDADGRLLFFVHVEIENDRIRIISARRATREERSRHDS